MTSKPPSLQTTPLTWLRKNLFHTWVDGLLTIVSSVFVVWVVTGLLTWVFTRAQWSVVSTNLPLFFVGRYPASQSWRLWIVLSLVVVTIAFSILSQRSKSSRQKLLSYGLLVVSFFLSLWLIGGSGILTRVGTNLWNGLLVTLLVAIVTIGLAFPLGVLLALGRQSALPIVKGFCTAYIELVRGLPLIGVLFMALVMLPLVLPSQVRLDRVVRAIAGLVLFNAAYLAENVRGGLQSVPSGQIEAAKALGLNTPLILWLIVLPQALRAVVPAIVGQFISLFKDTSLLALFALVELIGISRSILAQPQFLGRYVEVYLFTGLIYWIFCYSMSIVSRRLEVKK
ncbi:MAG: amino acid ABC transporter permease [Leptolyngbyaceae cyanobacterium SU_3_3]|nr:amino acid ABC transporter permease [Leptolyngbyaceae cyanobacterium SU_3_3]NJR50628.1 amino acid ABC transporter permease [Leptolyngbyaceae cyanobacterium CSU_1_3]